MATTVNMHEAKTHLSKLVAKAREGEETIIAIAGKPVARLVPLKKEERKIRRLGFLQGMGYKVPEDFNEMGRDEIAKMFYGGK